MEKANLIIAIGITILICGIMYKFGVHFGSLPGDIKIEKGSNGFYFPITTIILFNLIFLIVNYLVNKISTIL